MEAKKARQQNLFHINDMKLVFGKQINGEKFAEKLALKKKLEELYLANNGRSYVVAIEQSGFDPKALRYAKSTLKRLTKFVEKLTAPSDDVINFIVKSTSIEIPQEFITTQQKADYLRELFNGKIALTTTKIDGLNQVKQQHKELTLALEKNQQQVFKSWRSDYAQFKKRLDEKIAADLAPYRAAVHNTHVKEEKSLAREQLKAKTAELEAWAKNQYTLIDGLIGEVYTLKSKIDDISSNSVRLSRSGNVLSYLCEVQLESICRAVTQAFSVRQREHLNSVIDLPNPKPLTTATIKDLASADFAGLPLSILFTGLETLKQVREGTPVVLESDAKSILNSVTRHTKDGEFKYDETLLATIAALLHESLKNLATLVASQASEGSCNTLKVTNFHCVLKPVHAFVGLDYSEIEAKITEVW